MSFIELKNVTKTFNGANALKNLNITIEEGQVLGVLGKVALVNLFSLIC